MKIPENNHHMENARVAQIIAELDEPQWVSPDLQQQCVLLTNDSTEYYHELVETCVRGVSIYALCSKGKQKRFAKIGNGISLNKYKKMLDEEGFVHEGFYVR